MPATDVSGCSNQRAFTYNIVIIGRPHFPLNGPRFARGADRFAKRFCCPDATRFWGLQTYEALFSLPQFDANQCLREGFFAMCRCEASSEGLPRLRAQTRVSSCDSRAFETGSKNAQAHPGSRSSRPVAI